VEAGQIPLAVSDHDGKKSEPHGAPPFPGMVWIPGGTFLMGSDKHYPEERPAHRVTVDGFWIDKTPVTNERFAQFVEATGHVTFAEIPPNPDDYPGALPEMIYAGSLVFVKPTGPVDRRNIGNWWQFMRGADWRHPYGPDSSIAAPAPQHFSCSRRSRLSSFSPAPRAPSRRACTRSWVRAW